MVGLVIQNNLINGNTNNGIGVTNGVKVEIAFNTVNKQRRQRDGQRDQLLWQFQSIHDNVVHHNAQFGIYVK